MTIITFKDGILAADSLATDGQHKHSLKQKKIYLVKKCIYAFTGKTNRMNEYLLFLKGKLSGISVWEKDDIIGLKIDLKTKKVYFFEICGNFVSETEILDSFIAIGWGKQYAKGAMEMGASAIKAVKVACKYTFCQPPIHYIDINADKPKIIEYKEIN